MSNDGFSIFEWQKSSYSATGNCVEVTIRDDNAVAIRDSKNPAGGMLSVSFSAWQAFIDMVRTE
jgi:Domain of unknown function (DUF397)